MSKINLGDVKESYTPSEWALREKEYVQAVSRLEIPDGITTSMIKTIEADMDNIYTKAALDFGFVNRKFQRFERSRKALEKELFIVIKSQQIAGLKTVDEIGGAVSLVLKAVPVADVMAQKTIDVNLIIYTICSVLGCPAPASCVYTPPAVKAQTLMQAIYLLEERYIFLEQIMDILKTKHGSLIILTGGLKLEASIGPQGA